MQVLKCLQQLDGNHTCLDLRKIGQILLDLTTQMPSKTMLLQDVIVVEILVNANFVSDVGMTDFLFEHVQFVFYEGFGNFIVRGARDFPEREGHSLRETFPLALPRTQPNSADRTLANINAQHILHMKILYRLDMSPVLFCFLLEISNLQLNTRALQDYFTGFAGGAALRARPTAISHFYI